MGYWAHDNHFFFFFFNKVYLFERERDHEQGMEQSGRERETLKWTPGRECSLMTWGSVPRHWAQVWDKIKSRFNWILLVCYIFSLLFYIFPFWCSKVGGLFGKPWKNPLDWLVIKFTISYIASIISIIILLLYSKMVSYKWLRLDHCPPRQVKNNTCPHRGILLASYPIWSTASLWCFMNKKSKCCTHVFLKRT